MIRKRLLHFFALTLLVLVPVSLSAGPLTTKRIFKQSKSSDHYERLNQTLYYVYNQYVEPSRIDFSQMFESALQRLSLSIAELAYRQSSGAVQVVLMDHTQAFSTQISSIYALRNQVSDLISFVDKHKITDMSSSELEEIAIAGLLETLDPHTVFLSKEVLEETNVDIKGEFGGLGIVIGFRDGQLTVISPIDGTPASRAGIEAGDRIIKIEKEPTAGMTLTEAVSKMRGPKGEPIEITIRRDGMKKAKPFEIVRDIIQIVNIESAMLDDDIGYIRLKRFDETATKGIAYEVQTMQANLGRNPRGLILDLRNNPGGLLNQAIDVADLFLSQGSIVSTVDRSNRFENRTKARKSARDFGYPMAVLINQGSASASEIVAGALQKNNRALLIGQKTFGKGTVQKIFKLPEDTALKLTVSKYLTVNDLSIQSIGINPDIETQPIWIRDEDVRFYAFLKLRTESELDRSFINQEQTNDVIMSIPYVVQESDNVDQAILDEYQFSKLTQAQKQEKLFETFEIKLAHAVLSQPRVKILNRTELYKNAKSALLSIRETKEEEVQLALGKVGIDWDYPPQPTTYCDPKLLEVQTTLNTKKNTIQAGGMVPLTTRVQNKSDCTFYQVKGISQSKNPVFDQHFVYVGKVEPKQNVSITSEIEIPQYQPFGTEKINIEVTDSEDRIITKDVIEVPFPKQDRPIFKVDYRLDETDGAKQSLSFDVTNIGSEVSEELIIGIKQKGEKTLSLETSRAIVEDLKPGETKSVQMPIQWVGQPTQPVVLQTQFADIEKRSVLQSEIKLEKNLKGMIQAPLIELASSKNAIKIDQNRVTLQGTIQDDVDVKDFYVFVNEKKVLYKPFGQSQTTESFEIELELTQDENVIQMVARDENDVQGGIELHVLKDAEPVM